MSAASVTTSMEVTAITTAAAKYCIPKNYIRPMKKLVLFLLAATSYASTVTVSVSGVTPQQAVLDIRASDNTACTVQISEKSDFSTVANDVNESYSSGDSSCSRTGSIVSGNHYTFTAGYRGVYDGSQNWRYSRSLKANTLYYYKVSLASGATASGTFTTLDPPLGNAAPDPFLPDPAHPNLLAFPTVDWNNPQSTVVDPQTGMGMFPFTTPGDFTEQRGTQTLTSGYDPNSSWSLWQGGNAASCTGSACNTNPLVLWGETDFSYGQGGFRLDNNLAAISDLQVIINGYGSATQGADTSVNVCISSDFGNSCATNTITMVLPSGSAGTVYSDGKFPDAYFKAWGGAGAKMRDDMVSNTGYYTSVSGHTVTANWGGISPSGSPGGEFPVYLLTDQPNMPIYIGGTDPTCPKNLCHVASVTNSTTLQLVENISSLTYPTLTAPVNAGDTTMSFSAPMFNGGEGQLVNIYIGSDTVKCSQYHNGDLTASGCSGFNSSHSTGETLSFGQWYVPSFVLKVWKTTANGSITLNSVQWQGNYEHGNSTGVEGNNGNAITCGATNTTIAKASDGATSITPAPAFQCKVECTGCSTWEMYAVMPTRNESRPIGHLTGYTQTVDMTKVGLGDPVNYAVRTTTGTCRWTYTGNDASLRDDPAYANNSNGFTSQGCSNTDNFGNAQTPYTDEIASAYPEIDPSVMGSWIDTADNGGQHIIYNTQILQNDPYTWCTIDTTLPSSNQQVVYCGNSWHDYPIRWSGSHGQNQHVSFGPAETQVNIGGQRDTLDYNNFEYDMTVNTVYNNAGTTALTATFVDPSTCETLGVTDARWIAEGATGNNCIRVNIPYEPMQTRYEVINADKSVSIYSMDSTRTDVQWRNSAATGGQVSQLVASQSGATLTISGGGASASYTNHTYTYNGTATATVSSGTGWVFVSLDATGAINVNSSLAVTCSGCTAVQENTPYWPYGSVPLYDWHVTNGTFDASGTDFRRFPLGTNVIGSRNYPWAHNSSACNGDGSTSNCWAYLQRIEPGDTFIDNGKSQDSNEPMLVALKTELPDGSIDLVLARSPYDTMSGSAITKSTHAAGWGAYAGQTMGIGASWIIPSTAKPTAATISEYYPVSGNHGDQWVNNNTNTAYSVHSSGTGIYPDLVLGGYAGGFSIRVGTPPAVYNRGEDLAASMGHPFDGQIYGINVNNNLLQSHPAADSWNAPARESNWVLDGVPYGGAAGGSSTLWNQAVTLVSGKTQTYTIAPNNNSYGSGQSDGGRINSTTLKTRIISMTAGRYMFADRSGPNSASTWGATSDSQPWTYCIAMAAGECFAGSTVGQAYLSGPNIDTSGHCTISTSELKPCYTLGPPSMGVAAQFDISKNDYYGLRWRKITSGGVIPGSVGNYWNAHSVPDGSLAIVQCSWCNNGQISEDLAVKLPPWPNEDSTNRSTFVPLQIHLSGVSGSTVRARFGYAEYGADANGQYLFCGTRQEDCTTATSNSDPYAWAHETQTWTACSSACTVTIPAISGRVVYYVIDRNVSGTVTSSAQQVAAIN